MTNQAVQTIYMGLSILLYSKLSNNTWTHHGIVLHQRWCNNTYPMRKRLTHLHDDIAENISSKNINFAIIMLQERFMTCTLKELNLLFTMFTILGLNKITHVTGFTTGNSNTEDDNNLQWLCKYIMLSMASVSKVKKTCMYYIYKAMCVMHCAMFFYSGPLTTHSY